MKRDNLLFLVLSLCTTLSPLAKAQSGYNWIQSIGRPSSNGTFLNNHNLRGIEIDPSGNLYIAEWDTNTIDVLDPQGNFLFAFGCSSYNVDGKALPGTLDHPEGIARDHSGNFFVMDSGDNRIQKFDSRGRFLLQFGSGGSKPGQLSNANGLRLDSAGNIYVTEWANNRTEKFSPTGKLLLQIGSYGTGNGQLRGPSGIFVDKSGDIYVADSNNQRIQKFDPEGRFLATFGKGGSGNGEFLYPNDVDVDSAGNIYVSDSNNNCVQKINANGKFVAKLLVNGVQSTNFDSAGNLYAVASGTITAINPATMTLKYTITTMDCAKLALDSSNNVYVIDYGGGRLLKFAPSGQVLQILAIPRLCLGVAVDSMGNVFVADTTYSKILKYPANGGKPTTFAGYGSRPGQVNNPFGLVFDSMGNLYVADTWNSRIQKFSPNGNVTVFGNGGSGNARFNQPQAVTVDSSGNIYVADTVNNRIVKLDPTGTVQLTFGTYGSGQGQFDDPNDLVVDSSGYIYVTDFHNNRVQKFDSNGNFVSLIPLANPAGIRINPSGNLMICEEGNQRIDTFNTNGQFLGAYDAFGPNMAMFTGPSLSVRVDNDDNLYVVGNNSGMKITNTGNWLGSFGSFNGPQGMALDNATGDIYVADTGNNTVKVFDSNLNSKGSFGSWEVDTGQFIGPSGVALDGSGNVYVTDTINGRVEVFNSAFAFTSTFGSRGTANGQFLAPYGIAVTGSGDLLVVDNGSGGPTMSPRVEVFGIGANFPFLGSFGKYGAGAGQFFFPWDLNLDSAGNIYVADAGNNRVQVFNSQYNHLYTIGGGGGGANGQLLQPNSVATDSIGNVYIADSAISEINRISIFAPVPALATLNPTSVTAGSPTLSLTVTGSGFTPDAVIMFHNTRLTSTFVSWTQLQARIPASLLKTSGKYRVSVSQAGGSSKALQFTVN